MKCYKCGKEYGDNNNFCPYCGTKKGIRVCSACAHIAADDHKFCGRCGANSIRWMQEDRINLLKEALQGDAEAQSQLGEYYYGGEGVEQSYEEAVRWYRKAAEQGHAIAQTHLGICYEDGRGVEQCYEEAVGWYRKAAEQGYADAQILLGYCYEKGQGVEQSYEEAVGWYRKAEEQGHADAQTHLGICYENGQGVEQSYEEAVGWYRKAAEQGHAIAQTHLGYCYDKGHGVEQSYEEAVGWYRKAAEQGHAIAQTNLGYCYEKGQGVEQSYDEAVKWYRKAAEQGHADASRNLERLVEELNYDSPLTLCDMESSSVRYLFFDTETSGLPKNFNAPSSDTKNWPRLVQLSWIVTDEVGNKLKECNYIIRPNGFTIPMEATRIHGISNQTAMLEGVEIKKAVGEFMDDVEKCSLLIGHNLSFDKKIVGAELIRMGRKDTIDKKPSFCTMESTVDYCKVGVYSGFGYKFPKLQELHYKLFGRHFENEHDSSADVAATCKCFWELKKRGIIDIK